MALKSTLIPGPFILPLSVSWLLWLTRPSPPLFCLASSQKQWIQSSANLPLKSWAKIYTSSLKLHFFSDFYNKEKSDWQSFLYLPLKAYLNLHSFYCGVRLFLIHIQRHYQVKGMKTTYLFLSYVCLYEGAFVKRQTSEWTKVKRLGRKFLPP